jgi:hypothetical protein
VNGLKEVTLESVGGGVAGELFQREFQRVLANIQDPNTDPEKTRRVTIEVHISPSEKRDMATILVSASSKIAGVKPAASAVFLGRNGNKLTAVFNDPRQVELAFPAQKPPVALASGQTEATPNA